MRFRAGELDQLITIQSEVLTPDGLGGHEVALVEKEKIFAHVRPMSSTERQDFNRLNSETGYLFVVRNPTNIKHNDRIVWDNETYNITSIMKPSRRDMYVKIEAVAGVAQ